MTQYLILHKVRGEPSFDIAEPMACPLCSGGENPMCVECDEEGVWWIIATSGHRAYPAASWQLSTLGHIEEGGINHPTMEQIDLVKDPRWETLPDHYPTILDKSKPKQDFSSILSALVPPRNPIARRF